MRKFFSAETIAKNNGFVVAEFCEYVAKSNLSCYSRGLLVIEELDLFHFTSGWSARLARIESDPVFAAQIVAEKAAEEKARKEADGSASLIAQASADNELREEIVEELIAEGKARHVAMNLTNTEAKMLAEGRRLGVL